MLDALRIALDAAYAVRGVEVVYTPKAGTGPFACVAILAPAGPDREVARFLRAGERVAGYDVRLRQADVLVRPANGDRIAWAGEGLVLRVAHVETSALDIEWFVAATPALQPATTPVPIGHLQPPTLFGGWTWA